jgi:hypothetical protein
MRAPLVVKNNLYSYETILSWKVVWDKVCRMAYENEKVVSAIQTYPDGATIDLSAADMTERDHSIYYRNQSPANCDVITLDYTWKYYSTLYGSMTPNVVPEFKHLHVPRSLFESLGVHSWFRHSFPNCALTFWDD